MRDPHILLRASDDIEAATSPQLRRYFKFEALHDAQDLFVRLAAPRIFLIGPNGIGKSPSGAVRMIVHGSGWLPLSLRPASLAARGCPPVVLRPRELPGGRPARMVVLGISQTQAEGAAWAALREWLPPEFIYSETTRKITLNRFVDNPEEPGVPVPADEPGVVIELRTVESRRGRQQGSQYDLAWPDEESEGVDVYNEYAIQLGKRDGVIQGTLTPFETYKKGGETTWFGREVWLPAIAAREGDERLVRLDEATIVIFGQRGDQIDATTGSLMSEADIERRFGSVCSSEAEYRLRVEGKYDATPQQPYFPEPARKAMSDRLVATGGNLRRGRLVEDIREPGGIVFAESPDGFLHVSEEPADRDQYIVGADLSSGTGDDSTGAVVWSRKRRFVPAVFHTKISPALFKHQYWLLCRWYNRAWAVPDTSYAHEVIAYLREVYGDRLYRRRSSDTRLATKYLDYGFHVDHKSREAVLTRITNEMLARPLDVRYEPLANEILRFGWFRNNTAKWAKPRPDHPRGGHDDMLFALGYALFADDELPLTPEPKGARFVIRSDATPGERMQARRMAWLEDATAAIAEGRVPPPYDPLGHRDLAERVARSRAR